MNYGKEIYDDLGGAVFEATTRINGITFDENFFQCFISRNVLFKAYHHLDGFYTLSLLQFSTKRHSWMLKTIQQGVERNALASVFTDMTGLKTVL